METVPERLEPPHDSIELYGYETVAPADSTVEDPRFTGSPAIEAPELLRPRRPRRSRTARRGRLSATARQELLWVGVVYLATRGLLLLATYLDSSLGHHNFLGELANWDGLWYREIANHGYLNHVSHAQTTLGFFPLYPVAIWILQPVFTLTGHDPIWSATMAGFVISVTGGFVTTALLYRMATGWWGKESARRAVVLFCLFPGSVVFSMVYSEGILLPLVVGCIYALERRRWLLAGLLAGLGTAVQPTGLVLIPVCAVSAILELRRRGWRFGEARRAFVAPLLSLTGVSAFALFLWFWTGTPLANYEAQHYGWSEKTDPFALVHLVTTLAGQVSLAHLNEPAINLNLVVGLVGAILLMVMLVLMFLARRTIPIEAIVWTLGISFLALTSEYVPPNPRMLITAFPAIMVVGHYARGKWFAALAWGNGVLLIVLSVLTFYGMTLRP